MKLGPEIPAILPSHSARAAERTPIAWNAVFAYGAAGLGYIVPGTYLPAMAREIVPLALDLRLGMAGIRRRRIPVHPGLGGFAPAVLRPDDMGRRTDRYGSRPLVCRSCSPTSSRSSPSGSASAAPSWSSPWPGSGRRTASAGAADAVRHVAAMTAAFAAGQDDRACLCGHALRRDGKLRSLADRDRDRPRRDRRPPGAGRSARPELGQQAGPEWHVTEVPSGGERVGIPRVAPDRPDAVAGRAFDPASGTSAPTPAGPSRCRRA